MQSQLAEQPQQAGALGSTERRGRLFQNSPMLGEHPSNRAAPSRCQVNQASPAVVGIVATL
jgi:hypothetical protein